MAVDHVILSHLSDDIYTSENCWGKKRNRINIKIWLVSLNWESQQHQPIVIYISRTLFLKNVCRKNSIFVSTGSKYRDNGWALDNNRMPKIVKNNVPELTDLLRYWSKLEIFGGKALEWECLKAEQCSMVPKLF